MTDAELLLEFSRTRSTGSLEKLARQYAGLVYSTARRVTGDPHLAEDVTQAAFIVMVKKRNQIEPRALAGWLVHTTRLVALDAVRRGVRRDQHERRAAQMRGAGTNSLDSPTAQEMLPLLDDALARLSESDRTAVVLRFFQGMSFAEVGQAVGSTEEAARKRVDRAIEKMRKAFMRQGITPSAGALALTLASQQAPPASSSLVAAVTAAANGGSGAGTILAGNAVSTIHLAQLKFILLIMVGLFAAGGLGIGLRALARDRASAPATQLHRGTSPALASLTPTTQPLSIQDHAIIAGLEALDDQLAEQIRHSSYSGTYEIRRLAALTQRGQTLVPDAYQSPRITRGRFTFAAKGDRYFLEVSPIGKPADTDAGTWFGMDCRFGSDGKNVYIFRPDEKGYRSEKLTSPSARWTMDEPIGAALPRDLADALASNRTLRELGMDKPEFSKELPSMRIQERVWRPPSDPAGGETLYSKRITQPRWLSGLGVASAETIVTYSKQAQGMPVKIEVRKSGLTYITYSAHWTKVSPANGGGWLPDAIVADTFVPAVFKPGANMMHMGTFLLDLDPKSFKTGNAVTVPDFKSMIPEGTRALVER